MANESIRKFMQDNRIRQWMVSDQLGISESVLCRWLRYELTDDRKEKVLSAIHRLCEQ